MERADTGPAIAVTIAYSPNAGAVDEIAVTLASGATVLDALRSSRLLERHPAIDLAVQSAGIWGRLCPLDAALRDGDRVEVYRPLQVDPMQARRLRQKKQREAPNLPR